MQVQGGVRQVHIQPLSQTGRERQQGLQELLRAAEGPGNLHDQKHFKKTYQQVNRRLKKGSLVVFDKGAHSIDDTVLIRTDDMQSDTARLIYMRRHINNC